MRRDAAERSSAIEVYSDVASCLSTIGETAALPNQLAVEEAEERVVGMTEPLSATGWLAGIRYMLNGVPCTAQDIADYHDSLGDEPEEIPAGFKQPVSLPC